MAELERLDRMLPPGTEERDVWQYLDDFGHLWAAATMIRVTIENYGPRDMVSAWSKMLEEWRGKRKDQEREAARKREQSKE